MSRKLIALFACVLMVGVAVPAAADPQGHIEDVLEYGYFYGTFDQSPNVALFAGGTLEQFCFEDPGLADLRVFFKADGSLDLKVNDKHQPIYLYYTDFNDIPEWLGAVCPGIAGGADAPQPFAWGEADLKVRMSLVSESRIEIFNSVNGKAMAADGTWYKVHGSADFAVVNGELDSDPKDFVGFKLTEIRR